MPLNTTPHGVHLVKKRIELGINIPGRMNEMPEKSACSFIIIKMVTPQHPPE